MPSLTPKVASGALAGAASVIIIWILGQFHLQVPPEVASAFTTIISGLSAYLAPRSDPTPEQVSTILNTNAMQQNKP